MDKKKVGIVTFHTADNYGAVLQAYALQHYIESNGFDVRIINFNTSFHEAEHRVLKYKSKSIIKTIYNDSFLLLYYCPLKKRIRKFQVFREQFLNLTKKKYASQEEFSNKMEQFDYYISGSDQVFNPGVKYTECYYFHICKNNGKKIAYAPSFGVQSFTQEQAERISKLVSDFDCLSCREKAGSDFLSNLVGSQVPVVCDPVFLLSEKQWVSLTSANVKNPYIFVYDLNGGYELLSIAYKIRAVHPDYDIICVTTRTQVFYRNCRTIRSAGPLDFLSYIYNAECVVTDSFHGTAFSYIFKKKVVTLISAQNTSSRIFSLASQLGTLNQIVNNADEFHGLETFNADYTEKLKQYISFSQNYLKESLDIR